MEKLLNSTDNCISLKNINFDGFSTSKNWIGFFAWEGYLNREKYYYDNNLKHKASQIVYDFFKDEWNNFFLMTALLYDDNIENGEGVDEKYGKIYEKAKEKGLIHKNDENNIQHEEFAFNETPLQAKLLNFCFDSEFILPFTEMYTAMMYRKIIGQICFIINPKLKIALYPHDDTGFGCIDLGNNPKTLLNFLHYCDQHPDFISHIDEGWQGA